MFVHWRGAGNGAKGCVILGSLKPFLGQAVDAMVAGGRKDIGAQRSGWNTKRTDVKGLYYKIVVHGRGMVECVLLNELGLTSGHMLRWKAMSERVTRSEAAHQAVVASLQRRVEHNEGLWRRNDERYGAGSSGSAGKGDSFRALEKKCRRKEYGVWEFCKAVHTQRVWTFSV